LPDGSVTYNKLANNIRLFTTDNFTSNGTVSTFSLSEQPADANTVLVTVDGIVQRATEHYGLSGKTITFTSTPASNSLISIRHLGFRTTTTVTAIPPGTNISNPVITNGMSITGNVSIAGTLDVAGYANTATFADTLGVAANCTTLSGSTQVTYRSNTAAITVGMLVTGATINIGTTVTSISNANTLIISAAAANSSTNTSLSFYTTNKLLASHVSSPGLCKAWVNFNGTGTVRIRAAFNVSSITDNGTGIYTINFTTAMPDANYAATSMTDRSSACAVLFHLDGETKTTSALQLRNQRTDNNGQIDSRQSYVSIFR
jgi:hypothetical protein